MKRLKFYQWILLIDSMILITIFAKYRVNQIDMKIDAVQTIKGETEVYNLWEDQEQSDKGAFAVQGQQESNQGKKLNGRELTDRSDEEGTEVEKEGQMKKIALTFDDGPHMRYTMELLDGLKERNVKATFFVVGKNVEEYPEVIKRMGEDGHLIGNHTYSHVQLNKLSDEKACEEITKTSDLIKALTGNPTEYIRPPFGEWNESLECGIELIPVLWDVDPLDWKTTNAAAVTKKVVTKVEENDIILLHDCYQSSVDAALEIVDKLKKEGYEFVTVEDLIMD